MADLQPARSKLARVIWDAMVNDEPPNDETLEREGYFDAADAVLRASSRPTDRPDAYCVDCPFADRGDWVMYRAEYEALKRAEAERDELARILALEAMEIINGADRAKVADRMLAHPAVRAWIRSQDD